MIKGSLVLNNHLYNSLYNNKSLLGFLSMKCVVVSMKLSKFHALANFMDVSLMAFSMNTR